MFTAFVILLLWGSTTEVAFKVKGDKIYRQIKNGLVGANCFDESGTKIIAPSRIFGPNWVQVVSLSNVPKEGRNYSITCYPYASISDAPPVNNSIHLVGT